MVSPAALSILVTTFEEGPERNKALGIWGAIAGTGGAAGVLLGGVLTQELSWSWIFFINVPVGTRGDRRRPQVPPRAASRAGPARSTWWARSRRPPACRCSSTRWCRPSTTLWSAPRTIALFVAASLLLAGFLATERRVEAPLMPLHIFRNRSLSAANGVALMLGASIFSMFFLLTLYMQQVLGYSPLKTGIGYLLVSSVIVVSAGASQAIVTRIGVRTVLATGMALTAIGLLYFSRISVGGSYLVDLTPGFILTGIGLGFSFVPVSIAALVGVEPDEAGIASGILNTSQQIGGALGTAILSTVAFTEAADYAKDHIGSANAALLGLQSSVHGFSVAFLVGALISGIGFALSLGFIPRGDAPEYALTEGETEPAH